MQAAGMANPTPQFTFSWTHTMTERDGEDVGGVGEMWWEEIETPLTLCIGRLAAAKYNLYL